MKWTNKGHEFDEYANKIVRKFNLKQRKIYIFGAGMIGEDIRPVIEKAKYFGGFIDNDYRKQNEGVHGIKVISLQEYLKNGKNGIIIIAADKKNIPIIENQLLNEALEKNIDFFEYEYFMKKVFPVLLAYEDDKIYVELSQICLTERCTLKCKKCAHGCYAVDSKSSDMDIRMAKKSADSFFNHVDIVKEFVLIGGEPFLYRNLDEIIEYIGERYRDKIVIFSITTNGTIIPGQHVLDLCRKYEVTIRISDYSATIKYLEKKYEELEEKLIKNQVLYTMSDREAQWMDYGFETVDRKWNEKELMQVFDCCKTPCREIRGSRYYYCVMARSVSDNLNMGIGEKDYLDLEKIKKEDKKVLLEFEMGYSEKGYLDMCNYCNGAKAIDFPIPIAEQI